MNKKGIVAQEYILVTVLVALVAIFAMGFASKQYDKINQNLADAYTESNYGVINKSEEAENILKKSDEVNSQVEELRNGNNYTPVEHSYTNNLNFNANKPVYYINGKEDNNDAVFYTTSSEYDIGVSFGNEYATAEEFTCSVNKTKKIVDDKGNTKSITSSTVAVEKCWTEGGKRHSINIKLAEDLDKSGNVVYQLTLPTTLTNKDNDQEEIIWGQVW